MQTHSEMIRMAASEQGTYERVQPQSQIIHKGSTTILFEEPAPAEVLNIYLHHLCHHKRKAHHWLTPELCKLVSGNG